MYVVSGCSRSGTSLMMNVLAEVFGEDRILGQRFPRETTASGQDNENKVRNYLIQKRLDKESERTEHSKDMNPNGFWEMMYTIGGVYYRLNDIKRLNKLKIEKEKTICKIVSRGLIHSDPQYIDKILYMVRNPRSVAKSQEKFVRSFSNPVIDGKEKPIHSPEFFIEVTASASKWLMVNSHVPVLIVNYENLISNTKEELEKIQDFLGEGDFTKGEGVIDPNLNRSTPENIESHFWEDAEYVYEKIKEKRYSDVIDYVSEPSINFNTKNSKVYCTRRDSVCTFNQCKHCIENPITRGNFRKNSTADWRNEPCIFECLGRNKEKGIVTIEDSIKNNTWLED